MSTHKRAAYEKALKDIKEYLRSAPGFGCSEVDDFVLAYEEMLNCLPHEIPTESGVYWAKKKGEPESEMVQYFATSKTVSRFGTGVMSPADEFMWGEKHA